MDPTLHASAHSGLAALEIPAVNPLFPGPMVFSGGYSSETWRMHAESIEGILTRFDREP